MKRIVVWNPCTTQVRIIKVPTPKDTENLSRSTAIAYDSVRDDFTLIRLVNLPFRRLIQIYSLNVDSWRDSKTIPGNSVLDWVRWTHLYESHLFVQSFQRGFPKISIPSGSWCFILWTCKIGCLPCCSARIKKLTFITWIVFYFHMAENLYNWAFRYTVWLYRKMEIGDIVAFGQSHSEIIFRDWK